MNADFPREQPDDHMLDTLSSPFRYTPSQGKRIGNHRGAHFFTIGQRKGMNVGGHREPLFVIATDIEQNIVYSGEGHSHPGLNRKGLFIRAGEVHWIRTDMTMIRAKHAITW
jgi:tRNA-uridine 2-sulfurtransferase